MATINFSGTLLGRNDVPRAGKTVTVTVTKTDTSTETLIGETNADGAYVTGDIELPAIHIAVKAKVEADAEYKAVEVLKEFDVPLSDSTLTLDMNVV